MTALAAWAQALVGIANIVLAEGRGCVVHRTDDYDVLYLASFDDTPDGADPDLRFTTTYLHAGAVCLQYIANHPARELVSA